SECGHVFVDSPPDDAELEDYYAEVIPRLRAAFPAPRERSPEDVAEEAVELEKVEFLKDTGLIEERGHLLDIGFGNGGFVLAMSRLGWRCTGQEFTEKVDLPFEPNGH